MLQVRLRVPPDRVDALGRPWYAIDQVAGLAEHQGSELVHAAEASGYLGRVGRMIATEVVQAATRLAGERHLDVIELGGGNGALFESLRPVARTYINVEPGEVVMSEEDRTRLDDPRYASIRCSAEALPFESASADLILAVSSLDHVPRPDVALAEAHRCLRTGGHLIVTLNNRRSWWKVALAGTAYLARREAAIAKEHSVIWSLAECRERVGERFDIVDAWSVIHCPYVPLAWHALLPLAERVGRQWGRSWGAQSIVIGRAC